MRRDIDRLRSETFDVIVVGGGMHGAWVALRAALTGYRVALLERHDFGGATSANSLKILHGGLRYLQHLDFARMRSSIRARRAFAADFPEWVRPLPCVMPLQATGVRSPWVLGPALLLNDLIAADRNTGLSAEVRLSSGRLMTGGECSRLLAPLAVRHPFAGAMWWDALAIDTARLSLASVFAAADAGAVVANRVEATRYLLHGDAIRGIAATDTVTGDEFEIRAPVVVNATGPWAGELAKISNLTDAYMPPGWVGGMNLVLRKSLGLEAAVALSAESKASDSSAVLKRATRELFFVPWRNRTMVGTDYVPCAGMQNPMAGPPLKAVKNFVDEVAHVAPNAQVTFDDVAWVHWGLLPLASAGDGLPTKTPVLAAGRRATGAAGLVVVIGEKLTSAPELSLRVLAMIRAEKTTPVPSLKAATASQQVDGAHSKVISSITNSAEKRLKSRYGRRWTQVADCAVGRPELLVPVHAGFEVLAVEIIYAIRHEMARSLDDLVMRRLDIGDAGHPGLDVLKSCAEIAAPEFFWSSEDIARHVSEIDARLRACAGEVEQA